MPALMFRYALLTHLALPDDAVFSTMVDGVATLVRCIPRTGDKLFAYTADDYQWLHGTDTTIAQVKTFSRNGREWLALKIYTYNDQNEPFSAGYVEPTVYTLMEIVTDIQSTTDVQNGEDVELHKKIADDAKSRFVNMYRLVSQHTHVDRPEVYDSVLIDILISKDNVDLGSGAIEAEFLPYTRKTNWSDPFKRGSTKAPLDRAKLQQLNRMFSEQRRIELHEDLLLEAKSQAHLYKNCSISLVLCETAFEVFAQEFLVRLCQRNEVESLQVGRGKHKTTKPYLEAIRNGNITDLIGYIEELTEGRVKGTQEYSKWYDDAYSPRHRVVHNGDLTVTFEQSERAFNAVMQFIHKIEQLMR